MAVPSLLDFLKRRSTQSADDVYQMDQQRPRTGQTWQNEIPQIDTSDAIGSLAGILGPSPEERAAEEARLQQHRQKMHGWTALFNGLRHLSNLYFTAKGAAPQKYGDPHQEIEQQYQDERKRLDAIHAGDRQYYANLWGLYRQMSDEQRRNTLAQAQAEYYGTRDEAARQKAQIDQQKAELERLKAVRVIKQKDGSLIKFDPITGDTEELREADPLYQEYMRSQIGRNNRSNTGGSGGGRSSGTYGYRTTRHIDPATGDVITERVPTTGGTPQRTVTPAPKAPAAKPAPKAPAPKKPDGNGGGGSSQSGEKKKKKHVGW